MIRSLCYFLAARLGAYAPRLGAYATGLGVYATFSIPRGSFDPKNKSFIFEPVDIFNISLFWFRFKC